MIARLRQPGRDIKKRTARKGQPEQDRQNRTSRKGQAEQGRTVQAKMTVRKGQAE